MPLTRRAAILAFLTASPDSVERSPWTLKTRVTMAGSAADELLAGRQLVPKGDIPGSTSVHMGANASPEADGSIAAPAAHAGPVAFYGEVVVTWESAEPIRLARKAPLPAEFVNHYAIGVTGLPLHLLKLKPAELNATVIEVSWRKRERADYALRMPDGNSLLFAFPARKFPLSLADRFVSFSMNLNQMIVQVRFDLRQMIYRDRLAV